MEIGPRGYIRDWSKADFGRKARMSWRMSNCFPFLEPWRCHDLIVGKCSLKCSQEDIGQGATLTTP